jgi:cysteinyl-tRNA synthetase
LHWALNQKGDGDEGIATLDGESFKQKFIEAMDDDFNTAQAIAVLFELVKEINRGAEQGMNITEAQRTLLKLAGILALTLKEKTKPTLDAEVFIRLLVSVRDDLRQTQQWQLTDKIRGGLADSGIALEDTPQGTIWKYKR